MVKDVVPAGLAYLPASGMPIQGSWHLVAFVAEGAWLFIGKGLVFFLVEQSPFWSLGLRYGYGGCHPVLRCFEQLNRRESYNLLLGAFDRDEKDKHPFLRRKIRNL